MLKLSGKSRDTCQGSPATLHARYRVMEPRVEPWVPALALTIASNIDSLDPCQSSWTSTRTSVT